VPGVICLSISAKIIFILCFLHTSGFVDPFTGPCHRAIRYGMSGVGHAAACVYVLFEPSKRVQRVLCIRSQWCFRPSLSKFTLYRPIDCRSLRP
jgi:hypothetical protein